MAPRWNLRPVQLLAGFWWNEAPLWVTCALTKTVLFKYKIRVVYAIKSIHKLDVTQELFNLRKAGSAVDTTQGP